MKTPLASEALALPYRLHPKVMIVIFALMLWTTVAVLFKEQLQISNTHLFMSVVVGVSAASMFVASIARIWVKEELPN